MGFSFLGENTVRVRMYKYNHCASQALIVIELLLKEGHSNDWGA